MFNSLHGIISEKTGDTLRLITGGVEWDIFMPSTDINRLPPIGETGKVFTWLYHKETEMRLFGFADEKRRSTFLELLKVDGIGPRSAIKFLGGISQEALETALEREDVSRLEAVPGLGKKSAQKMILALKGKLVAAAGASRPASPYSDLVEALAGMGYDRRAAAEALAAAEAGLSPHLTGQEREKLLFKQAIVRLSSR